MSWRQLYGMSWRQFGLLAYTATWDGQPMNTSMCFLLPINKSNINSRSESDVRLVYPRRTRIKNIKSEYALHWPPLRLRAARSKNVLKMSRTV